MSLSKEYAQAALDEIKAGRPAVYIAVFPSNTHPGELFHTGRCEECLHIKGGENRGMISSKKIEK